MQLPTKVTIRATLDSREPVANVVFQMTLTTGRKNPYNIAFAKTGADGTSQLSADEIQGQFQDHWEADLMGHSGTLDEASQEVSLALLDVATLRRNLSSALSWPLLEFERTRWESRQHQIDYLLSSANESYSFPSCQILVPVDAVTVLELQVRNVA